MGRSPSPPLRGNGQLAFLALLKIIAIVIGPLVALASATGALRIGLGGRFAMVSGQGSEVPPWLVIVPALAFSALMFYEFVLRASEAECDVELDEGGVRWRHGSKTGYVALSAIRDVSQSGRFHDPRASIVLQTREGAIELRPGLGSRPDLVAMIRESVARSREHATEVTDHDPIAGARGTRTIATWLGAVNASVSGGSSNAHHPGGDERARLEAIALDRRREPEHRAAAAYAMLKGSDAAAAARVAKSLGERTPPIVIAAAAMAAPELVDRALLAEALVYLREEDANDVQSATKPLVFESPTIARVEGVEAETLSTSSEEPEGRKASHEH